MTDNLVIPEKTDTSTLQVTEDTYLQQLVTLNNDDAVIVKTALEGLYQFVATCKINPTVVKQVRDAHAHLTRYYGNNIDRSALESNVGLRHYMMKYIQSSISQL